ncbi:acyl-CoA dehydrogenase family protein [Blastococcus sp. BMG 814]|uniref:Acyl-CoA dehydrogenase family protein n=1 Tax=Blastococcus carthaginiensis TaxID=3050034 RepID=A0ABT9I8G4_9ACTN|nr:acyl-CoA dehydrogenase family protein [Blastococcus carthaginiensis]MDP5181865.1 acyl-CoA dehydrogenase family protein [Blastococcus carthaginiensis]
MDFTLGEELRAVRDLAREIFADRATPERARVVEAGEDRIDEQLWAELAKAGLVGVAVPDTDGGAGLGLGGLCVLLEEQGRVVAPVPLWPAVVGALAVAAHGSPEQRGRLLPGAVDGSLRLTLALEEFAGTEPARPGCTAEPDGERWRLTGTKAVVPSPFGATAVLVAAGTEQGPGLFLVAPDADGVQWQAAETTTHDRSGHLHLDGVVGEALGTPGTGVLDAVLERASVALAALQLGVAQGALAYAAAYVREREQFGRPLGTFQAVQHQLADCYIDIDALRVTLWQAVADLEDGAPDAGAAALVAAWWAGEGGLDVVHRVQHVHGGIGVDTDYPVHRHFLWGKQLAGTLGGPSAVLARLGTALAAGTASR